jgi:hypothetical protein
MKKLCAGLLAALLLGLCACQLIMDDSTVTTTIEGNQPMYTLETIEQVYKERLSGKEALSPDELIDLSVALYREVKLEGTQHYDESDMLLFEYGCYDWYDGQGECFDFSVTRQWFLPDNDEPYQLRIQMRYDPEAFRAYGTETHWCEDDGSIDDWTNLIRSTKAFSLANSLGPQAYSIWLEEC